MNKTQQNLTTASIWRLTWLHKEEILKSWDIWVAIVGAILSFITLKPKVNTVVVFASSAIGVTSAIIGIVLAGLAIVTAFLDRRYIVVLSKAGYGIATEVFNFRYPATIAVVSVIFSTALIVMQDETWYPNALRWLFPISMFFFLYTLFITLNLVASIGGHLMNRSTQQLTDDDS